MDRAYALEPGRYELSLAEGPDPTMSLAIMAGQGADDTALRDGAGGVCANMLIALSHLAR